MSCNGNITILSLVDVVDDVVVVAAAVIVAVVVTAVSPFSPVRRRLHDRPFS